MNTIRYSIQDRRLVVDYLSAVRNEVAVDLNAIKLGGLDPDRYGKFPRPSRWMAIFKNFAFLSRLIYRISLPIWFLLGPWLFRYQCKSMLANWQVAGPVQFDDAGQILAFSIRALDIVHARHIDPAPRQWVELPWLPLANLPTDAEVISVLALLGNSDIQRSLNLASLAHRALQNRRGMSGWGLQSFTAWRWFLVRLAVDKLPGPLLTVEHFDRWAVLVDRSVQRSSAHCPKRQLTVMQHGSVNADRTPRGLGIRLPTHLQAVNHLRVYSPVDADIFMAEILSPRCSKSGLEISFYRPSVTLLDMKLSAGPPSILFVGHPLCEAAHCALLEALSKKGNWRIFYKPHPANPAKQNIRKLQWTVVDGRSVFPLVDLLISYPSTLVSEYATHGIPAIVHSFDASAAQLIDRMPEIFHLIQLHHSCVGQPVLHEPTSPLDKE